MRDDFSQVFTPVSDGGPIANGAVGLIALATDQVCEHDVARILALAGVPLYVSRVAFPAEVTLDTLAGMRTGLRDAAALLLPGERLKVIAYGCTSGSMVIGEDTVFARLREARPGVECTTPPTAAMAAFAVLGMRRIAVLTPYVDAVNERVRSYLAGRGLDIVSFGSFHRRTDPEIASIVPESIAEAAVALDRPDSDGLFISCTALRTLPVIEALEEKLGKPVVTSNQAMAWHALRLADARRTVDGLGRLLRLDAAGGEGAASPWLAQARR
jgi:maleate isomerase